MPETPTTEPWAGTPPVPHALRPGAKPEAYMAKIAEGPKEYWVPIVEGVYSKPVWISPTLNMWADVLMAEKACIVNRHYHPKPIWAYTISGKWAYLEHDWTATAGDFNLRDTRRIAHPRVLRASRSDEGVLRRVRPADVA